MTETGSTVERLRGRLEGNSYPWFAGIARSDLEALLAVVEAAQELSDAFEHSDADELPGTPNDLLLRWGGLANALLDLHSQASDEGKPAE